MEVTFHRAFDEARQDPLEALRAVVDSGCTRLLTSGQAPTAPEGAAVIKRLVEHAALLTSQNPQSHIHSSTFTILAGAGITPANVRQLIEATGVDEVHGSCKTTLADGTLQTDAAQVRQLIANTLSL